MAVFGPFSVVFRTTILKVLDDLRYAKQMFPMRARCSFMAIRLSNDGKWVFNKACTTAWCHALVHFEVKMSRYSAVFQDDHRDCGGKSAQQASFHPQ